MTSRITVASGLYENGAILEDLRAKADSAIAASRQACQLERETTNPSKVCP